MAAEGGEEALEDAASARRAVESMKPAALVARLAEAAHDGALQIAGASTLRRHFEAASADGGGAACASELVACGAIRVLGAAVRRHRSSSGVARETLGLLAILCRAQPAAAAELGAALGSSPSPLLRLISSEGGGGGGRRGGAL